MGGHDGLIEFIEARISEDNYGSLCQDRANWPCRSLRILASVYSDHPDYLPEWKL